MAAARCGPGDRGASTAALRRSIMFRERFKQSLRYVAQALHDPEAFALDWQRRQAPYPWWVFAALILTAAAGTTAYGPTLGLLGGAGRMLQDGLLLSLAAGIAWGLPLPALYILNSLTGSPAGQHDVPRGARDDE